MLSGSVKVIGRLGVANLRGRPPLFLSAGAFISGAGCIERKLRQKGSNRLLDALDVPRLNYLAGTLLVARTLSAITSRYAGRETFEVFT